VIEKQLVRVNLTVYVILCTIAGLGIVVALSFLAINIRFRKHKYVSILNKYKFTTFLSRNLRLVIFQKTIATSGQ